LSGLVYTAVITLPALNLYYQWIALKTVCI